MNSTSDPFHSNISDEYIQDVFAVMRNCPEHIFQILTKRPGRAIHMGIQWPDNVWMGTSVENNEVVERLDLLRKCEARTLFVSFKSLVGPVTDLNLRGDGSGHNHRKMPHEWVWPIRTPVVNTILRSFSNSRVHSRVKQVQHYAAQMGFSVNSVKCPICLRWLFGQERRIIRKCLCSLFQTILWE